MQISGIHHGYFKPEENDQIIKMINDSGAEVLLVGMGVPMQEFWIMNNKDQFREVKIALAAGAVMDFISGHIKRAPSWVRKIKMEWFHRFLKEPGRLFNRYFIGNIRFFWYIISYKKSV